MNKEKHCYQDLIALFESCFLADYNTRLVKGEDEPIYLPQDEGRVHHELYFAHGFFASALHECAHWLVAGKERRKLVDFGYWYVPDGRSEEEQALFQKVEVRPQAIEWILSKAAGYKFRVSVDNLNGADSDITAFKEAVYEQVKSYCAKGLSKRAECLRSALCGFYGTPSQLDIKDFLIEAL